MVHIIMLFRGYTAGKSLGTPDIIGCTLIMIFRIAKVRVWTGCGHISLVVLLFK